MEQSTNCATRVVALAAHASDGYASRIQAPATHLRHRSPEWGVDAFLPDALELGLAADGSLQTVKGIEDILSVSLLVVQQPNTRAGLELVQWASRMGIAVVVDVVTRSEGPDRDIFLRRASEQADLVTVSHYNLIRRYVKHGRAEVADAGTSMDDWVGFWTRALSRKSAMNKAPLN